MTALIILETREIVTGYGNPSRDYVIKWLFILWFYLHSVPACKLLKYRAVLYLTARLVPYAYQAFPYDAPQGELGSLIHLLDGDVRNLICPQQFTHKVKYLRLTGITQE